jgi:hypothetical protein
LVSPEAPAPASLGEGAQKISTVFHSLPIS